MATKEEVMQYRRKLARIVLQSMNRMHHSQAMEPQKLVEHEDLTPQKTSHQIRNVLRDFDGYHTWRINPFSTAYNYQYFLDFKLNMTELRMWWKPDEKREKQMEKDPDKPEPMRLDRKPIESFIEHIINELEWFDKDKHILVRNAYIFHGSSERDFCLIVYTDDAITSIGRFIRDILSIQGQMITVTCTEVGWNRAYRGYSGEKPEDEPIEPEVQQT